MNVILLINNTIIYISIGFVHGFAVYNQYIRVMFCRKQTAQVNPPPDPLLRDDVGGKVYRRNIKSRLSGLFINLTI